MANAVVSRGEVRRDSLFYRERPNRGRGDQRYIERATLFNPPPATLHGCTFPSSSSRIQPIAMLKSLDDYRVFWGEFRRTFQSTGAVMPSGRSLCRALSRQVREGSGGRRLLEVGPGTGAVTRAIVAALQPGDTLDLV